MSLLTSYVDEIIVEDGSEESILKLVENNQHKVILVNLSVKDDIDVTIIPNLKALGIIGDPNKVKFGGIKLLCICCREKFSLDLSHTNIEKIRIMYDVEELTLPDTVEELECGHINTLKHSDKLYNTLQSFVSKYTMENYTNLTIASINDDKQYNLDLQEVNINISYDLTNILRFPNLKSIRMDERCINFKALEQRPHLKVVLTVYPLDSPIELKEVETFKYYGFESTCIPTMPKLKSIVMLNKDLDITE